MSDEGTLIGGRYRLEQPLGRGQWGVVWLASDEQLHRTVAARPLSARPGHARDEAGQIAQRAKVLALRDAELASELRHPCAATVYGAVAEHDDIWLITQYVPSRTMSDVLTAGAPFPAAQVCTLGMRLAGALRAAHDLGLVHRAVDPAAVLLDEDGDVQITDFVVGLTYGDSPYRAPEVRDTLTATAAADVYSLGATLHRATTGTPLPEHDGTTCPTGTLHEVLLRMLTRDPAARPTMYGVEGALTALAHGRSPDPASLSAPDRSPAPPRTQRPAASPPPSRPVVRDAAPVPPRTPPRRRRGQVLARVSVTVLASCAAALCGILVVELLMR
ncbi:serine/threonine protein kinase [Haloechinothrix sp. YIM 98757]|uniref:non-specific serine/threonine protein kinase n=1 Tax=Haloechinothrix aidingensis TaxID=2752311 RepID=A0A838A825_9PSEU|nr:serine/threonine protein kinase [Haloechinothrix aidingensis]